MRSNREYVITGSQRVQAPIKWRKSAVMSDKMRLVNGEELYDIAKDPGQENDIAKQKTETLGTAMEFSKLKLDSFGIILCLFGI